MGAGSRATEAPAERSVVNRMGAGAGAVPSGTAVTTTFTPRSSTLPWSASTSSRLSVEVAGTTLTPVPAGTAAGVVVTVTKAIRWTASNVVEPTSDATNCAYGRLPPDARIRHPSRRREPGRSGRPVQRSAARRPRRVGGPKGVAGAHQCPRGTGFVAAPASEPAPQKTFEGGADLSADTRSIVDRRAT